MPARRLLRAWRRSTGVGVLALGIAACASPRTPVPLPPGDAGAPAPGWAAPPEWRPGDRWTFTWTFGSDRGTRTVEVVEMRLFGSTPLYVLRIGEVDHLYTRELHLVGTLKQETVESRMTPPQPLFMWPMEAGRRWEHRGTYEDRSGQRQVIDTFTISGPELVEVPAGRFETMKVVREGAAGDSDEYWFAPAVGFHVKWAGRRGAVPFEEQLASYRAGAGELLPPPGPAPAQPPPPGSPAWPSSPR